MTFPIYYSTHYYYYSIIIIIYYYIIISHHTAIRSPYYICAAYYYYKNTTPISTFFFFVLKKTRTIFAHETPIVFAAYVPVLQGVVYPSWIAPMYHEIAQKKAMIISLYVIVCADN